MYIRKYQPAYSLSLYGTPPPLPFPPPVRPCEISPFTLSGDDCMGGRSRGRRRARIMWELCWYAQTVPKGSHESKFSMLKVQKCACLAPIVHSVKDKTRGARCG